MIYLIPEENVKDMDELWNWCKSILSTSTNQVNFDNWSDFCSKELKNYTITKD